MQVFPQGWDKTYCLQYVESEFKEIHFFGDKTYKVCASSVRRNLLLRGVKIQLRFDCQRA